MVFEWFWVTCVVIHLIKPVSGLTDWKPRKSTCVVFHSIWPLFGPTDYQPHCIRYEQKWTQCAIEQGKGKGKGKGKSASTLAKQIFQGIFRYFQTQGCCTTPQIVHRCSCLVRTSVIFSDFSWVLTPRATGQSYWKSADSKCSARWFDSMSPRASLPHHCLEHGDAL